jgi:hypothetical protein
MGVGPPWRRPGGGGGSNGLEERSGVDGEKTAKAKLCPCAVCRAVDFKFSPVCVFRLVFFD